MSGAPGVTHDMDPALSERMRELLVSLPDDVVHFINGLQAQVAQMRQQAVRVYVCMCVRACVHVCVCACVCVALCARALLLGVSHVKCVGV